MPSSDQGARVDIHTMSYRKRLADPDGLCAKWVIDGLVKAGVLVDDSHDYVRRVTGDQVATKVLHDYVVITLTEV